MGDDAVASCVPPLELGLRTRGALIHWMTIHEPSGAWAARARRRYDGPTNGFSTRTPS